MSFESTKIFINKYREEHPFVFYFLLIYLGLILFYILIFIIWFADRNNPMALNEVGDFLAGAFSPIAFLFLYLGYRQNSKALEIQAKELAISNSSLQKQCEELAESVKQQTELVLTAKEELKLTITQHKLINRQQILQAQPHFHIAEIKVKLTKLDSTIDISASFKIKNSRTMCRSLFFLTSFEDDSYSIPPKTSTTFDLFDFNPSTFEPVYVHTTISGEAVKDFNSKFYLNFCYTDAFDNLQVKYFKINLHKKDSITYIYDSYVSEQQTFLFN